MACRPPRDVAEEVTSIYVEEPCPRGPFGAKSAAEMSVIAPVPAIINAIADATGVRLREIPATPDKVLSALKAAEPLACSAGPVDSRS